MHSIKHDLGIDIALATLTASRRTISSIICIRHLHPVVCTIAAHLPAFLQTPTPTKRQSRSERRPSAEIRWHLLDELAWF